ncbi:MAG: hypothetical protein ABL958_15450 [Bdellovibrionia bacterium]
MESRVADEFLSACNRAFGFLVNDPDFRAGTLEVDEEIHFATVRYLGKNVAVECIFDQNESVVEVKMSRVVNGITPAEYSTNSAGRRVREDLIEFLMRRGIRGFGFRKERLSIKPLTEMFQIRLSENADLIKKYGSEIMQDSATLFEK